MFGGDVESRAGNIKADLFLRNIIIEAASAAAATETDKIRQRSECNQNRYSE